MKNNKIILKFNEYLSQEENEMNKLLDKISSSGYESLTNHEKNKLSELSKGKTMDDIYNDNDIVNKNNEYLTSNDNVEILMNIINDDFDGYLGMDELMLDQDIVYDETGNKLHVISSLHSNYATITIQDESGESSGSYDVKYQDMSDEIINNIIDIL